MNDKNLISVIIPVYNVEKYLERCLDSVVNQEHTNLEIIIVDDGSTDGSSEICDLYQKKDSRIRVIHKENNGLSSARNMGLEKATGNYICFIDSDDYINKYMLEKLLRCLLEYETDLVICGLKRVWEDGYKVEDQVVSTKISVELITPHEAYKRIYMNDGQYVVACNKLYRRELFSNLRYTKGMIHEDEMIIHRIYGECNKIAVIENELYFYRQRNNSITSQGGGYKRIDYYLALTDRIQYYYEIGEEEVLSRTILIYWEGLVSYFRYYRENKDFILRFGRVLKNYRKILYILLQKMDCSWRGKIFLIIFSISPHLYLKMMVND